MRLRFKNLSSYTYIDSKRHLFEPSWRVANNIQIITILIREIFETLTNMSKPLKEDYFVETFVIGFGLLSGIFAKTGVDPEGAFISALLSPIQQQNPLFAFGISAILGIFPVMRSMHQLLEGHKAGGTIGLLAIGLAWLGGFLYPSEAAVYLIAGAVISGYFASITKRK